MWNTLLTAICVALTLSCAASPAASAPRGYYEWQTTRPFSGWVGVGRFSLYCDYIKYPVRRCSHNRVCKGGKCRNRENCKVVGWRIIQSCS